MHGYVFDSEVPLVLREVLSKEELPPQLPNPDTVDLNRLTLSFVAKDGGGVEYLQKAFMRRNARRFLTALRLTTVIFILANIMLIGYDGRRFDPTESRFTSALIIRLAIMLPTCVCTFLFTYTRLYRTHTALLAIPFTVLGACLIAYAISGSNPGYGTLALLIVYMFSFSPLSVWTNCIVNSLLIIAFGISLTLTRENWLDASSNKLDAGVSNDFGTQMFNIMGVLIVFFIIVGFIGHALELSLKNAFLDEFRLQIEMIKLEEEKRLSAALLNSMLPPQVVAMLNRGNMLIAENVPCVTVLFCELDLDTAKYPAQKVVQILNIIFSAFDAVVDEQYVRKIETVASVWLGVSSPFLCKEKPELASQHGVFAAELALAMVEAMPTARQRISKDVGVDPDEIGMRIGLNSGPVAAGVVGMKNPRYKLIGDTVNTASRMESTCIAGRIQISGSTYKVLNETAAGKYILRPRGTIPVKGKGEMETFWLEGRFGETKLAPVPADEPLDVADVTPHSRAPPPALNLTVSANGEHAPSDVKGHSPVSQNAMTISATASSAVLSPTSILAASLGLRVSDNKSTGSGAPQGQILTAASLAASGTTAEATAEAAFGLLAAKNKFRALTKSRRALSGLPEHARTDTLSQAIPSRMSTRTSIAHIAVAALREARQRSPRVEPDSSTAQTSSPVKAAGSLQGRRFFANSTSEEPPSPSATPHNGRDVEQAKHTPPRGIDAAGTQPSIVTVALPASADESDISDEESSKEDQREMVLAEYFDALNASYSSPTKERAQVASPTAGSRGRSLAAAVSATSHQPLAGELDLAAPPRAPASPREQVNASSPTAIVVDEARHVISAPSADPNRDWPAGVSKRPDRNGGANIAPPMSVVVTVVDESTGHTKPLPSPSQTMLRVTSHVKKDETSSILEPSAWKKLSKLSTGLRWEDRATLCLNKSMMRGDAAMWEKEFQAEMNGRWRTFVRISCALLVVVLAIFSFQDWYKYGASSTYSNPDVIWRDVAITRYAVLIPVILIFLACTYLRTYARNWWFSQLTTGATMLAVGLDIIALSVVGHDPGYGVLALYIVYCVNFSLLALLFRFIILLLLIAAYIGSTIGFHSDASFRSSAAFGVVYLAIFFFGEMFPVLLREYSIRHNYFRKKRIEVEKRKLAEEQLRSTALLENLLPASIVPRLRGAERTLIADTFEDVTILWTDMKGFTNFSSNRSPLEVVSFLNAMFSTFDRILDKHGVRKIEVLGDAFFCCSGVPFGTPDHAERCANAAIEMQMHMATLRSFAGADISMRIGIHTGPVIAGVVGLKDPRYHLFGDSVPYANAMESNGEPGMVHISEATYKKLMARQRDRAVAFVEYVKTHPALTAPVQRKSTAGLAYLPTPSFVAAQEASAMVDDHGSYSLGQYPPVHMSLLDAYLAQVLSTAAQGKSSAITNPSHPESGPFEISAGNAAISAWRASHRRQLPLRRDSSGDGATGRPRRLATRQAPVVNIPEFCEGAVRGQMQIWKNTTFLGWDIQVNTVQGGLLYAQFPEILHQPPALHIGPPTPHNEQTGNKQRPMSARPDSAGLGLHALLTRRLANAESNKLADASPSAAQPGQNIIRSDSGQYLPPDPGNFFGSGAGFFAFQERTIDIKGRGSNRTYFLSRADPPFVPEVATALSSLQSNLESWAAIHVANTARDSVLRRPSDDPIAHPTDTSAAVDVHEQTEKDVIARVPTIPGLANVTDLAFDTVRSLDHE